jgi:putative ABC transport system ATP-binding protein
MVEIQGLIKEFRKGRRQVTALVGVNLKIESGAWVTVTGPSGSGKSTLLYSIAGLVRPTAGRVIIDGEDVYALSQSGRARLRGRKMGFIFQSFHLFPHLNVLENVLISGGRFGRDIAKAVSLLQRMGLSGRTQHMPSELSVGEKQRVAVARAVFNRPSLILADEPTGNLDGDNGKIVINYLREFQAVGMSVVFVTHRPRQEFEPLSTRIVSLNHGMVEVA